MSNYKRMDIDLTADGNIMLAMECDYVHMFRAEKGGALALDAEIELAVDSEQNHYLSFSYNTKIYGKGKKWYLRWAAQPGVTASLLFSWMKDGVQGVELDSPPARQLVTSSIGAGVGQAAVTVGTTAVEVRAATGTRQALTIYNNGSATIYLGDSAVTAANGLPVAAGAGFVFTGTTAAIYAVSASAGQDVRILEES